MTIAEVGAGALVQVEWNGQPLQGRVEMVITDQCQCRGGDQYVIRFENGDQLGLRRQQFTVLALGPDRMML